MRMTTSVADLSVRATSYVAELSVRATSLDTIGWTAPDRVVGINRLVASNMPPGAPHFSLRLYYIYWNC